MKHFCHKICLVVLACFSYLSASAYDFEADGLYFTITSLKDLTVSVDGAVNKDTDKIVIPQTVVYKGRTLTVTSVGDKAFSVRVSILPAAYNPCHFLIQYCQ